MEPLLKLTSHFRHNFLPKICWPSCLLSKFPLVWDLDNCYFQVADILSWFCLTDFLRLYESQSLPSQHLNFISSTIKVLKIMLINKITWHYLSQPWGTCSRDLQNIPSQPILLTPFFPSSSSHHPKWCQQLSWKQLDLPKQAIRPDISTLILSGVREHCDLVSYVWMCS